MKKLLLGLALLTSLACVSCNGSVGGLSNETINDKGTTLELAEGEVLNVYSSSFTDTYRLDGYSNVHVLGNNLRLTKITYTYYGATNALDVETDTGLIKYRGFSTNYVVVSYASN